MRYLDANTPVQGAEGAEDVQSSTWHLENQLADLNAKLTTVAQNSLEQAKLLIEKGYTLLDLDQRTDAWWTAQSAFNTFLAAEQWEGAVQACHILFLADQPASLVALGNGIWLAVTFPIDPELSVALLEQLVNETPDDADGAAIAAATAHYIVDLRAKEQVQENLLFFTGQLLAKVARRHSQVETQTDFEAWFKRLELDAPADFLGRLAQILEVMVQDDWWYDRDVLRAQLPH
jgi:hypothetical protein